MAKQLSLIFQFPTELFNGIQVLGVVVEHKVLCLAQCFRFSGIACNYKAENLGSSSIKSRHYYYCVLKIVVAVQKSAGRKTNAQQARMKRVIKFDFYRMWYRCPQKVPGSYIKHLQQNSSQNSNYVGELLRRFYAQAVHGDAARFNRSCDN